MNRNFDEICGLVCCPHCGEIRKYIFKIRFLYNKGFYFEEGDVIPPTLGFTFSRYVIGGSLICIKCKKQVMPLFIYINDYIFNCVTTAPLPPEIPVFTTGGQRIR